jgi:hypothetical protein
MGNSLGLTELAAIAAALGFASGLRLYAVVFITGAAGYLGYVDLPSGLQLLQNPLVIGAAFLMAVVEFFADKLPALDSLWDAVHTLVRIPAGAALAAGVFGGLPSEWGQAWALIAALAGGTLAATAHAAKASTRAAANTSPEPFTNIGLSLAGDMAVPALLWLSWTHPLVFWPVLALLVLCALALVVVLFKFLRALLRRLAPRRETKALPHV